MTNFEWLMASYPHLVKAAICTSDMIGLHNSGQPKNCKDMQCIDCLFNGLNNDHGVVCNIALKNWLEEEHHDFIPADTPVDTLVGIVLDNGEIKKYHLCKVENGEVYVWLGGRTSMTVESPSDYARIHNAILL